MPHTSLSHIMLLDDELKLLNVAFRCFYFNYVDACLRYVPACCIMLRMACC